MGVVVVASGSSPSAYIRGLIRRIDRGDPNALHPSTLETTFVFRRIKV